MTRRLPDGADIRVREGQRVSADDLLGKIGPHHAARHIDLAKDLDVAPGDVSRYLEHRAGAHVEEGAPLAKIRRGLRNQTIPSPVTGLVFDIDARSGIVLIVADGADEVRALVPGDVAAITGRSDIVIRTVGSRVLGIVGLGPAVTGPLFFLPHKDGETAAPDEIAAEAAGCIVVARDSLTARALQMLASVGVAGVVTGSLAPEHLASAFGWHHEDRLAPWRSSPTDHHIAADAPVPFPLMATEGFGMTPMHRRLFDVLLTLEGQTAALFPHTSLLDPLARPELVIANTSKLDEDAPVTEAVLREGTSIRLVTPGHPGREAVAVGTPYRHRFTEGQVLEVIDVHAENDQRTTVPVASVEIIS